MWVRGLKHRLLYPLIKQKHVAPHVGAWIETSHYFKIRLKMTSHPMWVRGLKQAATDRISANAVSHPMWVRGLKRKTSSKTSSKPRSHPMWVRGLKPW